MSRRYDWILRSVTGVRLKHKLLRAFLIAALVCGATVVGCTQLLNFFTLRSDIAASVNATAEVLSENARFAVSVNDVTGTQETLDSMRVTPAISSAIIYDTDGRIFAAYTSAARPSTGIPDTKRLAAGAAAVAAAKTRESGLRWLVVRRPLDLPDGRRFTLEIEQDLLPSYYRDAPWLLLSLLLAGVLSVVVTFLHASRLRDRIAGPLERLVVKVKDIAYHGRFNERVAPGDPDEIGVLIEEFNNMLDSVAERDQQIARKQQELDREARTDRLTGLPNRREFEQLLETRLRAAGDAHARVALLFIDVDNFKRVNDARGHATGDALLRSTANRIEAELCGTEKVCRFGGDEFVVIADYRDRSEVDALANRLVQSCNRMHSVPRACDKSLISSANEHASPNQELYATVSIGVSTFPQDAQDALSLARYADLAMYAAKNDGKAGWKAFAVQMNTRNERRLRLESLLRRVLENDELYLEYQPLVHLRTGRVIGCEALARWHCTDLHGMICPSEFIPVAEEIGLIEEIGARLLARACRQAKVWSEQFGVPLRMAVNISKHQLNSKAFPQTVRDVLRDTGLSPAQLELELVENQLFEQVDEKLARIAELRALGVGFAIDDFGTGYSSFSYFATMPATQVKIDRSFVTRLPSRQRVQSVVRGMLSIAADLGVETVAEGIEHADTMHFLAEAGCTIGQGYYFSSPLSASAFTELLAACPEYPCVA